MEVERPILEAINEALKLLDNFCGDNFDYSSDNHDKVMLKFKGVMERLDEVIKLVPCDPAPQIAKVNATILIIGILNLNKTIKEATDEQIEAYNREDEREREKWQSKWSEWSIDTDTMDATRYDQHGNEEEGDYEDWEGQEINKVLEGYGEEREKKEERIRKEELLNLKSTAISICSNVINKNKDCWHAYYQRARLFLSLQKYNECLLDCEVIHKEYQYDHGFSLLNALALQQKAENSKEVSDKEQIYKKIISLYNDLLGVNPITYNVFTNPEGFYPDDFAFNCLLNSLNDIKMLLLR